ncbi:MAG: hypothetical protein ABIQ44_02535, partial [Chloroflexia bacterium]
MPRAMVNQPSLGAPWARIERPVSSHQQASKISPNAVRRVPSLDAPNTQVIAPANPMRALTAARLRVANLRHKSNIARSASGTASPAEI